MVQEVSHEQLKQLLSAGAELVDVREDEELATQHPLHYSKHWPLSTFGLRYQDISKTCPTIFYCRSGLRSLKAAEIAAGWTDQSVYSLSGGLLSCADLSAPLT